MAEAFVRPLRFQREAIEELDEAIAWYNAQQAELGLAFHAAVRVVLESIRDVAACRRSRST